jgi:hypothetical protein
MEDFHGNGHSGGGGSLERAKCARTTCQPEIRNPEPIFDVTPIKQAP